MALNRAKHVRYWRMCANILPDAYQSSDASRMSLGFFMVAALDLLGVLHDDTIDKPTITAEERHRWVDWIYSCQIPDGQGFRAFPGTDLGEGRNPDNRHWDPGNLPNTFFALAALVVLGDDLQRTRRPEILAWLPQLQRADGSFGEILGPGGVIEGGRDLRFCCCAAGIAYVLQGSGENKSSRPAFDEARLIDYILNCQSYTGAFGESPGREPHSGLNYCAISTLELLARRGGPSSSRARQVLHQQDAGVRWLLQRQTTFLAEESDDESDAEDASVAATGSAPFATAPMYYAEPSLVVGFNGRDNKIADTCYCFWNSGALAMLESLHLANLPAVRRYLLEKVQHMIGGFAKGLESPPDVMHSYLGLATLSLYGESGIASLDPALCISQRAAAAIKQLPWHQGANNQ